MCPVSTGGGTRRVQLVREGGGRDGGVCLGEEGLRGRAPGAARAGAEPRALRGAWEGEYSRVSGREKSRRGGRGAWEGEYSRVSGREKSRRGGAGRVGGRVQ